MRVKLQTLPDLNGCCKGNAGVAFSRVKKDVVVFGFGCLSALGQQRSCDARVFAGPDHVR